MKNAQWFCPIMVPVSVFILFDLPGMGKIERVESLIETRGENLNAISDFALFIFPNSDNEWQN